MRKLSLAFFLAFGATAAQADTVFLKEGGRLEGTVVVSTDREVVLDTPQGRVRIDADRVRSVEYGQGGSLTPTSAPAPSEYRVARRRFRRREEPLFETPLQSLSIDFGLAAPLSSVNGIGGGSANNGDVGPLIGLQYLYYVSPRAGLGMEVNYYDRSATDSPGFAPNLYAHVYGDSVLLMGNFKYSLTNRGSVRPYFLLGAGAHETSTTIRAHPNPGFIWSDSSTNESRDLVDDNSWGPAASVRLGLDLGFIDPTVFGLEAGWTGLWNAGYRPTEQGQALGVPGSSAMLSYFTLAARWGWSF